MGKRELLETMLSQHDITYAKETAQWEGDRLRYYEDDSYSGRVITTYIDEYGFLYWQMEDDSPEQCGGWRVISLYKDGKEYILNNIADVWCYFIHKDNIYLVEGNDCCAEQTLEVNHVLSADTCCEDRVHTLYYEMVSKDTYDEVVSGDLKEFGLSKIK